MNRDPIPTWFFVLVVVRKEDRFLVVHERKHGQRWYLPAGRVEPGESFVEAAERETLEETAVPVAMEGVLRIEHTAEVNGGTGLARVRVLLLARPVDDTAPKSQPDSESLGAAWVRVEELDAYPLRGEDVKQTLEYVAAGGTVYPLTMLTSEGAPFPLEPTEIPRE